jgi:hypothetical protein
VEQGVLVIDPSIAPTGPLTLMEWAGKLRVRSIMLSNVGLSQAEIVSQHAARARRGEDLDAVVFNLKLGEAPLPERGGTGFCIGPDPPQGVSACARRDMAEFLDRQKKLLPGRS